MSTESDSRSLPAKPEPRDPWAFEVTKANPLRSYTKSRDDKGFSQDARARIHPGLHDLIWHIIGNKKNSLGWKSMGDAIRDSLVQRISQVAELLTENELFEYESFMRHMEWLESAAVHEHRQQWVTDSCEAADRLAGHYIQRDQPEIGAQRIRAWLKNLPHDSEFDLDDPDADYVYGYVNAKIEELEELVRIKFRDKKRPVTKSP